jgi:WD40 repeat protein
MSCVNFSPDGRYLAAVAYGVVRVWDLGTGKLTRELLPEEHEAFAWAAFTPDGKALRSANLDAAVKLWDWNTATELGRSSHKPGSLGGQPQLAFSLDGRRAAATQGTLITVVDTSTGERHRLDGHTSQVVGIVFNPDGRRLASASVDGTVKIWDPITGREALTFRGITQHPTAIAFSADGWRLAVATTSFSPGFRPFSPGLPCEVWIWDATPSPTEGGR